MKLKLGSLILFCSFSIMLKAQIGTVIFDVAPLDATIKIDNQLLQPAEIGQPKTSLELASGTYEVQIWSFGMELYKETIIVNPNDTVKVSVALKPTTTYVAYRKELGIYDAERDKLIEGQLPIIISAGVTTVVTLTYATANGVKLNQLKNQLEKLENSYQNNIDAGGLTNFRNKYDEAKIEFNELRGDYHLITAIGSTVSLGLWSYTFYKVKSGLKDVKKPTFNDNNPLSNVRFDLKNEWVALSSDIPAISIYYQF